MLHKYDKLDNFLDEYEDLWSLFDNEKMRKWPPAIKRFFLLVFPIRWTWFLFFLFIYVVAIVPISNTWVWFIKNW